MLAGDTNDFKLDKVLKLSPKSSTILILDKILDNIVTDMSKWYQIPKCLPALEADTGSGGKPSDHLTVVMEPISVLNNRPARVTREVEVRPLTQTGLDMFGVWIKNQNWNEVIDTKTCDEKAEVFQNMLLKKLNEFLPLKKRKISSDDQPFCNEKMKRLKRIKNREFQKNRKSLKWMDLNKQYKKEISLAKKKYYIKIVKDLKSSNPSQWYS